MKTIFTLLLSTLFTITTMAFNGSRLTVSTLSNQKMFVELDGRRFNFNGNTVSFTNIPRGVHNVRIIREIKRKNGFIFGPGNRREEVIYSINATMKNGYHFDILVNRFGKVFIDERRIDAHESWYDDNDYYENGKNHDRNDRRWDDGPDYRNRDDQYDQDDNDGRYDDYDNDWDRGYGREMNATDFSQAKESLRKEWFENNRVSSAKQIIDRNYFTSAQVKELLLLFTFENNRLELAKYAYGQTVDKGNYFKINDVFTFTNNKDELSRYIRNYNEK